MDKFQRNIYFALLFGFLFIAFVLLFVYYSQNSSLDYFFNNDLTYDDIGFSYSNRSGVSYVESISGVLGSVTATNEGVFPKKVYFHNLLVCFNYTTVVPFSEVFNGIFVFVGNGQGYFVKDSMTLPIDVDYRANSYYNRGGRYDSYNFNGAEIREDEFWKYDIHGLIIYELPHESDNPFGEEFDELFDKKFSCRDIDNYLDPVSSIKLS